MHGQPAAAVPPEDARRQRLLHIVFVVVIGITAVVVATSLVPGLAVPWSPLTAWITGAIGLVYVAGLLVLRTGRIRTAGLVLLAGVILGSWLPATVPGAIDGARSYAFIGTNVLIAAYAVSARAGIVVAGIDAAGLAALWRWRTVYSTQQFAEDMLIFTVFATILIAVAWFNEGDRRAIQQGRAKLSQSLATQHALMDHSPDAIVAVDPAGRILSANRVATRWAAERFHAHLVPGMDVHALLPSQLVKEWESLLAEALRCGAVRSETLWDDNGPNWFQIFLHATPTGNITVQVRDVSEERRAELHAREAYRDRIELEKLRDMDAFRLRLLNTASHELRTPITPLRLQLSILQRHVQGNDAAKHSVEVLNRNVDRLAILVDDLLDVARLEGGELRLERQSIELDAFLAREMEGYDAVAADRGVQIVLDARSLAGVEADPGRLAQVFTNLLTNALKYSHPGGTIEVRAARQGGMVLVEVHDDGAGFAPARASLLFQPFSQLHDGGERRDGTGLGLFICKGIIERHGGTIWGRSDGAGQGATFGFRLPARATLKQEARPQVVQ